MPKATKHAWTFPRRIRPHPDGWRSQTAVKAIREGVSEIKKVARRDMALGAEGAVLFLERLSPAVEHVDGSSGALGTAANAAVETLVPFIALAPVDDAQRETWLERLWEAYLADGLPVIESLGDHWGTLCGSAEVASRWADRLEPLCAGATGYCEAMAPRLSSLLAADRPAEVLEALGEADVSWLERRYGVQALAALGRPDDALAYATMGTDLNADPAAIAKACEAVLLDAGRRDEAYARYGLEAGRAPTYLAWYRNVARTYPEKAPDPLLTDLVAHTPGKEGKWFAAARAAGLHDLALELIQRSPADPQTLLRAAQDTMGERPDFAEETALAAVRGLLASSAATPAEVLLAVAVAVRAGEYQGDPARTNARLQRVLRDAQLADPGLKTVLAQELRRVLPRGPGSGSE